MAQQRTVASILREMDQIRAANIDPMAKQKFLAQKHAELENIAASLPEPPGQTPPPAPTPAAKTAR